MASLTQWSWVWVNTRSWWWTGRPDVLQAMGSQRVRHDWATELNCTVTLTCHHYPTRELCSSWSYTLGFPSLTWLFKMLCWNPSWEFQLYEHWLSRTPCSTPYNSCWILLHHNLVSARWFYCAHGRVSGPKCWFSNRLTKIQVDWRKE